MMNCIIVDDELPAIQELRYFIKNFSSIKIQEEFQDSVKALKYIQKNKTDIIFLDINMPKLDGLTLGKVINTLDKIPTLVFISAHKEFALDAFQVAAFDYILKPYSEARIVSTLNRLEALKTNETKKEKISLWRDDKLYVVNIKDILYCKSDEHDIVIYVGKEKYRITSTISGFYDKLPAETFFRSHRSYIVNLDKITEMIPWFNSTYVVKLGDMDDEIPISRQNIGRFKQLMGI